MVPISVVIPMYNGEKYIEKCIDSLQNQSYANWEAIIVNDGSTDNGPEICKKLASADSRITVIHQKNQGVSAARNTGVRNAAGEYVMFLDADDTLDASAFAALKKYIDEKYEVICWSLKSEYDSCSMSDDITLARENDLRELKDLKTRVFTGWSLDGKKDRSMHFAVTKLISKKLLLENNLWFDQSLKYHEDTLFSIQVIEAAKSIAAVNRFLYIRTVHSESATVSYCPNIHEGNKRYLELLRHHIDSLHAGDINYEIAYTKYQLSCFLQSVKLDCMHAKAPISARKRRMKIHNLLNEPIYHSRHNIWRKEYKWTHRILHYVIKYKLAWCVYFCVKAGLV